MLTQHSPPSAGSSATLFLGSLPRPGRPQHPSTSPTALQPLLCSWPRGKTAAWSICHPREPAARLDGSPGATGAGIELLQFVSTSCWRPPSVTGDTGQGTDQRVLRHPSGHRQAGRVPAPPCVPQPGTGCTILYCRGSQRQKMPELLAEPSPCSALLLQTGGARQENPHFVTLCSQISSEREKNPAKGRVLTSPRVPGTTARPAPLTSCSSGFCSSCGSSSAEGGMLLLMLNVTVILQKNQKQLR